ncbi:hypothetical protein N9O21_01060 [Rhodobacteraceae bacterium]|nr:hypothetical protein [Paracoccaceae bacterium]
MVYGSPSDPSELLSWMYTYSYEFAEVIRDEATLNTIKEGISKKLKDPSSAILGEYVWLKTTADGSKIVCGEVNGKNSYGAYAGLTPFIGLHHDSILGGQYMINDDENNIALFWCALAFPKKK